MAPNDNDKSRLPLPEDDEALQQKLFDLLSSHHLGDPYGDEGATFAANIAKLPAGLRAMAATHWLDISLTLDSITWHFGNFGDPRLVLETEAGLRELSLKDLADCFVEAKELMMPLLAKRIEADGNAYEILERVGLRKQADGIDGQASALAEVPPGKSAIYDAWIRYTRRHPERVFNTQKNNENE